MNVEAEKSCLLAVDEFKRQGISIRLDRESGA
jgi:hypothetical protein